MTFVQMVKMEPAYPRTLFSRHGLHLRLQATKLLASLTYPLKKTKGSIPCVITSPRASPHRHQTSRQLHRGPWVWVAPAAITPKVVAQVW
jgi:hypothetical protein